ncbi:MAG: c-type cytochrome, partial [Anaerolineales bacterium]
GPLRPDQIRDITQFILNWEATALGGKSPEILELPAPLSADPVARGKFVFNSQGCAACHVIEGLSAGLVGPDLTHIGTVAAARVDGMSAEDYLRESIINPNAFITPECPTGDCLPDTMPQNFVDKISPEQIEDLIAFLLAQE